MSGLAKSHNTLTRAQAGLEEESVAESTSKGNPRSHGDNRGTREEALRGVRKIEPNRNDNSRVEIEVRTPLLQEEDPSTNRPPSL